MLRRDSNDWGKGCADAQSRCGGPVAPAVEAIRAAVLGGGSPAVGREGGVVGPGAWLSGVAVEEAEEVVAFLDIGCPLGGSEVALGEGWGGEVGERGVVWGF